MQQPTQWFDADDEDGAQVWDAGADGWFRRSITRFVETVWARLTAEQRESVRQDVQDVVEWFAARAADFVFWEDAETYNTEFQSGGWRIDWPKVAEAVEEAMDCAMADDDQDDEVEERKQEADPPARSDAETVERFLGEIDVALYDRRHNAVPCPEEPAAWQLAMWGRLTKGAKNRLYRKRSRLLARWPRYCGACGVEFRGPQGTMTRCAKCRRAGRVAKSA